MIVWALPDCSTEQFQRQSVIDRTGRGRLPRLITKRFYLLERVERPNNAIPGKHMLRPRASLCTVRHSLASACLAWSQQVLSCCALSTHEFTRKTRLVSICAIDSEYSFINFLALTGHCCPINSSLNATTSQVRVTASHISCIMPGTPNQPLQPHHITGSSGLQCVSNILGMALIGKTLGPHFPRHRILECFDYSLCHSSIIGSKKLEKQG